MFSLWEIRRKTTTLSFLLARSRERKNVPFCSKIVIDCSNSVFAFHEHCATLILSLSLSLTPSRSADEEKTFSTKKLSERMENKNCFNKLDTSLYLQHSHLPKNETRVKAFQSYIGTLATTVSSSTHDKKLPEMPSVGHGEDAVVSATIRSGASRHVPATWIKRFR